MLVGGIRFLVMTGLINQCSMVTHQPHTTADNDKITLKKKGGGGDAGHRGFENAALHVEFERRRTKHEAETSLCADGFSQSPRANLG